MLMPSPLPRNAPAAPPKHRPVAAGSLREGQKDETRRAALFVPWKIVSMLTISFDLRGRSRTSLGALGGAQPLRGRAAESPRLLPALWLMPDFCYKRRMRSSFRAIPQAISVSALLLACGGVSELELGSTLASSSGGASAATGGKAATGGNASGGKLTTDGKPGVNPGSGASSSAGGAVSNGGSSAGGSPGIIPVPPQVANNCDSLCKRQVAANCPNEDDLAGCITGCRLFATLPACSGTSENYFSCSANSPAYCNGQGEADFAGCEGAEVNQLVCVLNNSMNPALEKPCSGYCKLRDATFCPNNGSRSDCSLGCSLYGSAAPSCTDEWQAYLGCAQTSPFMCNAQGEGEPQNCTLQILAYAGCILTAASTTTP